MEHNDAQKNIDKLKIPLELKNKLLEFTTQLRHLYEKDLISIIAYGSSLTDDFNEKTSNVNLLVIYSDLNITDLNRVNAIAQKWLKKYRFTPRFLSKRNLINSVEYFQIDLFEMKDSYAVLCGEDVLYSLKIIPKKMLWQISYELKAMRMRIKQQYWTAADNEDSMKQILKTRFTSIIHLSRALLFIKGKYTPISHKEIMNTAVTEFGLNAEFISEMFLLKINPKAISKKKLIQAFVSMLATIRILDTLADSAEAANE